MAIQDRLQQSQNNGKVRKELKYYRNITNFFLSSKFSKKKTVNNEKQNSAFHQFNNALRVLKLRSIIFNKQREEANFSHLLTQCWTWFEPAVFAMTNYMYLEIFLWGYKASVFICFVFLSDDNIWDTKTPTSWWNRNHPIWFATGCIIYGSLSVQQWTTQISGNVCWFWNVKLVDNQKQDFFNYRTRSKFSPDKQWFTIYWS